ncbi:MAG: HupE/UreJ family protein [Microthrixaceae bacterium]
MSERTRRSGGPRPAPAKLGVVGLGMIGLGLIGPIVAILLSATPASAHDNTSGGIALEINDRRVVGTAPVRFAELGYIDTSGDDLIDGAEVAAQEAALAPSIVDAVRDHVGLTIDGEATEIIGAGVAVAESEGAPAEASEYVSLRFATGPHDGDVSRLSLDWTFTSPSSEVVVARTDGVVVGGLDDSGTAAFSLDPWSSAVSFFGLGIDHIRFGPDHLLFLLVLTLAVVGAAVTRASTMAVVKLVTAFTIGHAISLCLVYLDVISVPASIVEPIIALSVVAAAVLALRGSSSEARPWIAGVIGLVHGVGFASSLGSLGVATANRPLALAAFNVGIDVAQTIVVLLTTGALWCVGKVLVDRTQWVRIPLSATAGLIGLVWTFSRLPF